MYNRPLDKSVQIRLRVFFPSHLMRKYSDMVCNCHQSDEIMENYIEIMFIWDFYPKNSHQGTKLG